MAGSAQMSPFQDSNCPIPRAPVPNYCYKICWECPQTSALSLLPAALPAISSSPLTQSAPATPASTLFLRHTKWTPSSGPLHRLFPPSVTPYFRTRDFFPYFLQILAQASPFQRALPGVMSFKIEPLLLLILFLPLCFSSLPLVLLHIYLLDGLSLSSARM